MAAKPAAWKLMGVVLGLTLGVSLLAFRLGRSLRPESSERE